VRRLDYKWLVGIAFVFGVFMDLLDTTIVNVALPDLQQEFNVGVGTIEWVVTGYLLSLAIFIPAAGYFADRFGTKRIYMLALTIFTAASALCGLAWSAESLIGFRILQGIGGGMLVPVGTAMLFREFRPEERASASALFGIPIVLAPTLGPILGGALVEYADWRWIFWINVPVGIAGLIYCWTTLREWKQPAPGRFDTPGFLLAASGFGALLYGLSVAAEQGEGIDSPRALAFMGAGALLLVALALVELRAREPMLDLRLFRDRGFALGNLIGFVIFSGAVGGLFLYPLFLQNPQIKDMTPLESGLTTFPQAVGVGIMMPIAGRLFNRVGGKPLVVVGTVLFLISSLVFTRLDVDMSDWLIRGTLVLRGMGFALVMVSVQTIAFYNIVGQSMGRASSLFNVNRQVAGSFGVAILATVLSNQIASNLADGLAPQRALVHGFQSAFLVASAMAAVGVVVAVLMRVPKPDPEIVAEHATMAAD
jgi:EmrB/QacA subfamily drug resistance transporter